jgi:hypothetical protein
MYSSKRHVNHVCQARSQTPSLMAATSVQRVSTPMMEVAVSPATWASSQTRSRPRARNVPRTVSVVGRAVRSAPQARCPTSLKEVACRVLVARPEQAVYVRHVRQGNNLPHRYPPDAIHVTRLMLVWEACAAYAQMASSPTQLPSVVRLVLLARQVLEVCVPHVHLDPRLSQIASPADHAPWQVTLTYLQQVPRALDVRPDHSPALASPPAWRARQ